jgi:RNA polymerase sigma factor (sigma-70 family)
MEYYKEDQENDEHLLWQRFKTGDKEAFARIYSRYVGVLYNYGRHIIPDSFLVEDAIQDLFTDLWRMRENLADTNSIKFYLFRSLRRKIRQLSRGEYLFDSFEESDQMAEIPIILSEETLRINTETIEEQRKALQKALIKLPARQFEAIRLRFFDGFELEEVANIMQMNGQSARNLIQRSLRSLRSSLVVAIIFYLFEYFF